jgi:hypothetical protein
LEARRKAKNARLSEEHAAQMAEQLTSEQKTRDSLNDQQGKQLEDTLLKDAVKVSVVLDIGLLDIT